MHIIRTSISKKILSTLKTHTQKNSIFLNNQKNLKFQKKEDILVK